MKSFLAVLLIAVMMVGVAHAQNGSYYRWKDASGTVHYSEAPPPAAKAMAVKVSTVTGSAGAASSVPASGGTPPALGAAEAAARTRNCENAQANLKTIDGGALLVDGKDPATARRMSADQLAAARKAAQTDIATYCGGPSS